MMTASDSTGTMTQPGDVVTAVFEPCRTDTLRDRARWMVGRTLRWEALWFITDEDGGDYVGQWAWQPLDVDQWPGWVPTEDLRIIDDSEDLSSLERTDGTHD